MKKSTIIIIVLLGLIIVLSVAKTFAYNRLSTSGGFVGKIEEEINFYKTQNAILSEKLLASSSLTNVLVKAAELGFVEQDSLVVLKTLPLAAKQ